jgi:hypothetical protein
MSSPSIVPFMRMQRSFTWRVALAPVVLLAGLVPACGQIVPLEEEGCPCASGWTCCDAICIVGACSTESDAQAPPPACSGTLALGTELVPGAADAAALPSVQTVTGQASGRLTAGTPATFNYAMSVWPKPYGWQLDGWLMSAASGQSFSFQLWSEQDAGDVPLGLVMYGPLEGADAGDCSGSLQGSGPMLGSTIAWTAGAAGTYFAAPYHWVSETPAGLAFQGLNDSDYAHAVVVMNSAQ